MIGMCAALERARWSVWDLRAALLPYNYVQAVQRAGGLALMLAVDPAVVEDPEQALELIDGLVLAGGADIDPGCYGERAHAETVDTVPERDAFEIALTRAAIERDLPVLGICRGMQLINVARGGTLLQHLPELLRPPRAPARGRLVRRRRPRCPAERGLAGRARRGRARARDQVPSPPGRRPAGGGAGRERGLDTGRTCPRRSSDGRASRRFVLGVQWHPEADTASGVIAAFVAAAASARVPAG